MDSGGVEAVRVAEALGAKLSGRRLGITAAGFFLITKEMLLSVPHTPLHVRGKVWN